jgi:hypothetical protein
VSDWVAFLWIVGGILLSMIVPIVVKTLREPYPEGLEESRFVQFVQILTPYAKYAIASLVLGVLTLAIVRRSGGSFQFWHEALMLGYFWDATVQKVKEGLGP